MASMNRSSEYLPFSISIPEAIPPDPLSILECSVPSMTVFSPSPPPSLLIPPWSMFPAPPPAPPQAAAVSATADSSPARARLGWRFHRQPSPARPPAARGGQRDRRQQPGERKPRVVLHPQFLSARCSPTHPHETGGLEPEHLQMGGCRTARRMQPPDLVAARPGRWGPKRAHRYPAAQQQRRSDEKHEQ